MIIYRGRLLPRRRLAIALRRQEPRRRKAVIGWTLGSNTMLLAVETAISTNVLAKRSGNAEIRGVIDLTSNTEAHIGTITLGAAIQFVANASVLGYDVRSAMVFYGEPGTPSLRTKDCERLWAVFGGALLRP